MILLPLAIAARIAARCEIDLSPGIVTVPRNAGNLDSERLAILQFSADSRCQCPEFFH